MIVSFFDFGTLWFWAFFAVFIVIEWLVYDRKGTNWHGFGILIIFLTWLTAFTDVQFGWLGWLRANLGYTVTVLLPGYLATGAIWSILRWYIYLIDMRHKYLKLRNEAFAEYGKSAKNVDESSFTRDYIRRFSPISSWPPQARDHKSMIVSWIIWWWVSALDFFLADFIHRIGNFLYNLFSQAYQNMSNRIFKQFTELE